MKKDVEDFKTISDPFWLENGYGARFQKFQNLMRYRIRDVLIVSSLYDLYLFEEDGRLYELIRSEYHGLNLSHTPELTHVASGKEAIKMIQEEKRFDLIITTLHIEDMPPSEFAKKIRQAGISIPVVMLTFDNKELADMLAHKEDVLYDYIFIWQGNYRLLLAIIKCLEDHKNVEHDTHILGVQSIILVEDNIRDYSSFLPTIFIEIINQSQRSIREGISLAHKNMRQRARPKILLCRNYEEAWRYYKEYHDTVLGVISDIDFPRKGREDLKAGLILAKEIRKMHPDIPILLQSARESYKEKARQMGCEFLFKNSPNILENLRQFMLQHLGFGDFVFRTLNGHEVGRASDLVSLEKRLKIIPDESLQYHAERNHFSNWLKARTEFWLAHKLRPRKVSDFASISALRKHLISSLRAYRKSWQRGIITDFNANTFDPKSSISRLGDGALGGKARGLSFFNTLINSYNISNKFEGIRVFIPAAIVLTTDIFDRFLAMNNLLDFALHTADDLEIVRKFLNAEKFPQETIDRLRLFLEQVKKPLAIRSSSMLEDSHNHPFAGVYGTYMLPNSNPDLDFRLFELLQTIKRVYASTYFQSAKEYIKATTFRPEEEKMAVVVQLLGGSRHENRFYPTFSGSARSFNFYPVPPQKSIEGIANIALGLGKMVVEGGTCVRFSPRYPKKTIQFSSPKLALENNQHEFFALDMDFHLDAYYQDELDTNDHSIIKLPLQTAEKDGVLSHVGSTFSPENDVIYDDINSPGIRLVSFAPVLKYDTIPLTQVLSLLLKLGNWGMGTPVEIEFAVNMDTPKNRPKELTVLQIRPLILHREVQALNIEESDPHRLICRSGQVMGNGIIDHIFDIVLVDRDNFDRAKSQEVRREVSRFNVRLKDEKRPYLLIGAGRWGSQDPWLGIPVTWDQISGARTIIETGFIDLSITPSQGSHFFENLNSFHIGYFTVGMENSKNFIDWKWLLNKEPLARKKLTRLLRFDNEIIIKMNGKSNEGIILKPDK